MNIFIDSAAQGNALPLLETPLVQSSSYKTKQRLPTTRTSNQGYLDIHAQEASPGITDPAIQGIKQRQH